MNGNVEMVLGRDRVVSLEELTQLYEKQLRKDLKYIGKEDVEIGELEYRDASEFEHELILAEPKFGEDRVAMLLSAQSAEFEGRPIRYVLSADSVEGSYFTNDAGNTLGSDFFYIAQDDKIIPVHTDRPIRFSGFNVRDPISEQFDVPDNLRVNDPFTNSIETSKTNMQQIIEDGGIRVAKRVAVPVSTDVGDERLEVAMKEAQFTFGDAAGIVVKADDGCGGAEVELFAPEKRDEATKYAKQLLEDNHPVLIEERLVPAKLYDAENNLLDWNIRAFVTLEDDPQWVDGVVRHKKWGYEPVNICQGAQVAELTEILERAGIDFEKVKRVAIENARVVRDYHREHGVGTKGKLGLDLMVLLDEDIATIEVNGSHSGGYAEIVQVRGEFITAVRDVLLPSFGPYLNKNFWKGQGSISLDQRIEKTYDEKQKLLQELANSKINIPAARLAEELLREKPDDIETMRIAADCYEELEDRISEKEMRARIIEHPDATIGDRNDYGIILIDEKKWNEARDFFKEIEKTEEVPVYSLSNLAVIYDALRETRKSLKTRKRAANHPNAKLSEKRKYVEVLVQNKDFDAAQAYIDGLAYEEKEEPLRLRDQIYLYDQKREFDKEYDVHLQLFSHPHATLDDKLFIVSELVKGKDEYREKGKELLDGLSDELSEEQILQRELALAKYHHSKEEFDEVEKRHQDLISLVTKDENKLRAHNEYYSFLEEQDRFDEALEQLDEARKIADRLDNSYEQARNEIGRGFICHRQGKHRDALEHYDTADAFRTNHDTRMMRTNCHNALGEFDIAMALSLEVLDDCSYYDTSIAINVSSDLIQRGLQRKRKGLGYKRDFADAEKILLDILDNSNEIPQLTNQLRNSAKCNLATIYRLQGEVARPLHMLREMYQQNPKIEFIEKAYKGMISHVERERKRKERK